MLVTVKLTIIIIGGELFLKIVMTFTRDYKNYHDYHWGL